MVPVALDKEPEMKYVTADTSDEELRAIAARLGNDLDCGTQNLLRYTLELERRLARLELASSFGGHRNRIAKLERQLARLQRATPPHLTKFEKR